MQVHIITIFPGMFASPFAESIIARAIRQGKLEIHTHNLRDWSSGNYQAVDDHPYGGDAGMVLMIEPLYKALKEIKSKLKGDTMVIAMSAKGSPYRQQLAQKLSTCENLIIICGHYEGIDERVLANLCDLELSIGNYVLSGGEVAAMVVVDSLARLLPGVLGNEGSLNTESHNEEGVLEYPHYTKPAVFITDSGEELKVPQVLLSGDHKKILAWREANKTRLSSKNSTSNP